MPLTTGHILQGRYRIIRPLGTGGMGEVYMAEDTRLDDRRCAVKESRPDPTLGPPELAQLHRQFQKEASILAKLDHPNLPSVTDYFVEGGSDFLVMDYVEGETLEAALVRHVREHRRPLPEKPVLIWADQVLDALDYMHTWPEGAVIHRDIKPANIILTPHGRIKLVDFGLVKLMRPGGGATSMAQSMKMGTPQYAPLEQYSGNSSHTDARSDIYSLGATLYHLLTNVEPPMASTRAAGMAQLAPARTHAPELTAATDAALAKACAVRMDERFQTAGEMRGELGVVRQPEGERSKAPPKPGLTRSPPKPKSRVTSRALMRTIGVIALLFISALAIFRLSKSVGQGHDPDRGLSVVSTPDGRTGPKISTETPARWNTVAVDATAEPTRQLTAAAASATDLVPANNTAVDTPGPLTSVAPTQNRPGSNEIQSTLLGNRAGSFQKWQIIAAPFSDVNVTMQYLPCDLPPGTNRNQNNDAGQFNVKAFGLSVAITDRETAQASGTSQCTRAIDFRTDATGVSVAIIHNYYDGLQIQYILRSPQAALTPVMAP